MQYLRALAVQVADDALGPAQHLGPEQRARDGGNPRLGLEHVRHDLRAVGTRLARRHPDRPDVGQEPLRAFEVLLHEFVRRPRRAGELLGYFQPEHERSGEFLSSFPRSAWECMIGRSASGYIKDGHGVPCPYSSKQYTITDSLPGARRSRVSLSDFICVNLRLKSLFLSPRPGAGRQHVQTPPYSFQVV